MFPTVPLWEKKFCASIGSVPWRKLIEVKRYMCLHPNVVNWNDSAVKEAFNNAKSRFWAEINDIPCDIPLPDPNIYIDEIDWNSSVNTDLYLDVEREVEARRNMEEKGEEVVIVGSSLLLDQSLSGPGWGDEEDEKLTKPYEPNDVALGWESNQHENKETSFWGGNWRTCDGYNRKKENNISWSNENQMNSGRRRNGGRMGNFAYVEKVATPCAW